MKGWGSRTLSESNPLVPWGLFGVFYVDITIWLKANWSAEG